MEISWKNLRVFIASIALLTAGVSIAAANDGGDSKKDGADVQMVMAEKLANVPGKSMTAVVVNYAPGAKSTEHQHAGSVFAYVLSGAIRSENSATGPVKVYKAGESFFEPAGTKHLVSENASATEPASMLVVFVADDGAQLTTFDGAHSTASSDNDLAHQIFETMIQVPGTKPGFRAVHAKGIVCQGTFTPSRAAASLSKAAHFQGNPVPITVRYSDGATDPYIQDNSDNAGPRGMAIRFQLPGDDKTDIVAMSHNGFVVSSGEEFLALQKAIVATDPSKPHPWPIEAFISTHPAALKFVQENQVIPASFATEAFFSNDSFIFVNKNGVKQAGRYKILPIAGQHDLSAAEAKARSANFLTEDLRTRLTAGPIKYRLIVQLPNAGDPTKDPSLVWPEDRKTIEVGTISITTIVADSDAAERALAFDPAILTDGIEFSDDILPALRSRVYALASKLRRQQSGQANHP